MFSIKVMLPNVRGHKMHECAEYEVAPRPTGKLIVMKLKDGTTKNVDIPAGGMAYVMGDSGKTVELIRTDEPRTAQMRGGSRP